jgi:hypothetical protein
MSNLRNCALSIWLAATFFVLSGCGTANEDAVLPSQQSSAEDFSSTGFVTGAQLSVRALDERGERVADGLVILPEGTEVAILERRVLESGESMVRIGVDWSEGVDLPNDFWVAEEELLNLEPYAPEDYSDEEASLGSSEDEELTLSRRRGRSMTYCYRYVKMYLLQTGKVRTYLPGTSAYMAARILPRYGFHRTGNGPQSAANGEVCVYAGGPRGHGHIEVKRNGKWWYGYGFKNSPISNRRFLGCFAR